MRHNDIRNSLCDGCLNFTYKEKTLKWTCLLDDSPLRLGKHKIPLKNQMCGGPYFDMDKLKQEQINAINREQKS